ncbi:WD repeat-containing protein 74 [Oopsacas minuta]|uniref:WD repeat-containing protein 74 n=1 Tax=Oopsacas minuta TaxID=111878 RepID=A0AAV7JX18_9METZ|nr:WD repeat-containing protein 74 [Oopsacas minuta]
MACNTDDRKLSKQSTCWVGTNLGILKSVNIENCNYENYFYSGETISTVDRNISIAKLIWGDTTNSLFVGLHNGLVREFDTNSRVFTRQCNVTDNKSELQGLHYYNNTIISCTRAGRISAWPFDGDPLVISTGNLSCMSGQPNSLTVATGGEENDLKIWDFSMYKGEQTLPIFQSKNVREDKLCMRQPVYITSVDYVPNSDYKILITGTGYNQIRQYDTRVQRRPVLDTRIGAFPITCVSAQEDFVIVANSVGTVQIYDFRKQSLRGNLKGSTGSVRDVSYDRGYVGVCGIDRFTRIYTEDRKLVNKVYTKLEQTSILLDPQGIERLMGKDTDEEVDELWDGIQPPAKRQKT